MFAQLSESECVHKFFDTLSLVSKFNQEKFKCALGVSKLYDLSLHISHLASQLFDADSRPVAKVTSYLNKPILSNTSLSSSPPIIYFSKDE